jgi:DNA-directed RNA polymerase specialized sigma24 family protein
MKDYLLDLLNNHDKYQAKINLLKKNQQLFHNQDEFDRYMQIENDLQFLYACIAELPERHREIIEQIYFHGFSLGNFAKVKLLSKGAIQNRKRVALCVLGELFALKS